MDAFTTPSNWQRVRFGDILSYEQPTKFLVATTQYLQKGFTPILTAGKTFILGYTNDKHGIYTNIPVIIFDDFTTDSKMVNFPFKVKSSAIKILSLRDNNQADLKYIYEKLTLLKHQVTDHKRYWIDEFSNFEILLPPLNEQIAITNILSALDRYLYNLDALILKKESVKKALSFELLSQRKRLKGFNQAWQKVRLGDMTTSFTKQTGFDYSDFIKPTLIKEYLPNYIPFIQNKDFLGHYINYKTDYFIPNEIAIRFPQILLNEKCLLISISGAIGNVAVFNHSQNAFIGGAIAVLKFKEKKSLDFVMHFLMSASGQKLLLNSVKSSSHKNLTIADLRDLLIPLPSLNEQIAIANILSDLDSEIISLKNKKRQFENIKKALNHDLMSAKIRVLKK
ncbi:restriction endonuclease subunit S [Helicobacter pylori]|nr:restriction endonuclease subunit S [Helicobacter pylori]